MQLIWVEKVKLLLFRQRLSWQENLLLLLSDIHPSILSTGAYLERVLGPPELALLHIVDDQILGHASSNSGSLAKMKLYSTS
jgi:hypothetical protein